MNCDGTVCDESNLSMQIALSASCAWNLRLVAEKAPVVYGLNTK